MVIWDNLCSMHRGGEFNEAVDRRDMRRTTINESGPETSALQWMIDEGLVAA